MNGTMAADAPVASTGSATGSSERAGVVHLARHMIQGDADLAALYYTPAGDGARAVPVVLAHGYTGSKETVDVMAGYLCASGHVCLTFDFRGHKLGGSTGQMLAARDAVDDLRAAIGDLRSHTGSSRVALVGHSMGGAAALVAASEDPEVLGVAALGTSGSVLAGFGTRAGEALMAQRGDYVIGAPAGAILAELANLCGGAAPLGGRAVVFVAARGDVIVPSGSVRELALRHGPSAEMVVVEGGHMDLPVRARGFVAQWLGRVTGG
jgi:pimeloyl-ACP methyl ester carboxylesterase